MKILNKSYMYPHCVIIAYTDRTSLTYLKWLRRGFRHCLVLRSAPPHWVLVDTTSNHTQIAVLDVVGLADYLVILHRHGYRFQMSRCRIRPSRRVSFMPCTCVEAAKRILGIVDYRVWTPYQLYNHINRNILTT